MIGIAAIFKNEKPYILEWIAAHIVVGVDKFFIADNNSTDGTSELLAELEEKGIVNYIPFPGVEGEAPQLPAYRKIMELYGKDVDWIAFIDADEFLIPSDNSLNLKLSLDRVLKNKKAGAIAINWSIYGSSNLVKYESKPVLKRFTKRAAMDFPVNFHYKSIVRTEAYDNVLNPHIFLIKPEYDYVHADGEILRDSIKHGNGLSESVIWSPVKLNHYVVKSRAEFENKIKRGRADIIGGGIDESYFLHHDQNAYDEKISDELFQLIENKISELE
jgi:glycosyltransferase involved in cell wall biosynthesis